MGSIFDRLIKRIKLIFDFRWQWNVTIEVKVIKLFYSRFEFHKCAHC